MTEVVLVDGADRPIGTSEKVAAHAAPGLLHRALSAFVFTSDGRLLLQRRARTKYHFAGLWSNTCCTHPRPGEDVVDAAERRVHEELGLSCSLATSGTFTYRAVDAASGMVEHELDHVLVGVSDQVPHPNPDEVSEVRFVDLPTLRADLDRDADRYTPWLGLALGVVGPAPVPPVDRPGHPKDPT